MWKKFTKLTTSALALTLALGAAGIAPARALDMQTEVVLTVNAETAPEIFSVKVPSEIPLTMSKEGVVSVGQNLAILNQSDQAVEVNDIQISGKNGWSVTAFSEDLSKKPLNTKEITFQLRGGCRANGRLREADRLQLAN